MISAALLALSVLVPSALAAESAFNPEYYANPWTGVCASGLMQTPIDLPANPGSLPGVPEDLVSDIKMPSIKAAAVKDVGNAMQIAWDPMTAFNMSDDAIFPMVAAGGNKISDVVLNSSVSVEYMLKMIPLQVHWHASSEHSIGGLLAPMEAHIVTAVGPGEAPASWGCDAVWKGGDPVLEKCIAVFGIVYVTKPEAKSPGYFDTLFKHFPATAGAEKAYPYSVFNLDDLLPEDRSYDSYVGSLTTPPCAEGLRWHVFTNYIPISIETVVAFETRMANITDLDTGARQLYRHNNRPVQPLNNRVVYHHDASGGSGGSLSSGDARVRRERDQK